MNTTTRDPRTDPRLGDTLWFQRTPCEVWLPVRITAVDAKAVCFTYSAHRDLSTVSVARDRWRAYAATMKLSMPKHDPKLLEPWQGWGGAGRRRRYAA